MVSFDLAFSNLEDGEGVGSFLEIDARVLSEGALDGADAGAFFGGHAGIEFIAQRPDFSGADVIAAEEASVAGDAAAEAGAEGDTEEVFVAFGAPCFF